MERNFGKIVFEFSVKKSSILESEKEMLRFKVGLNQHVHNYLYKLTCRSSVKIRGAQRKFEQMGPQMYNFIHKTDYQRAEDIEIAYN